MNRALTATAAALILLAGLSACGDDDEDPAVESTPVVSTAPGAEQLSAEQLSAEDLECKDEIVRQMSDPSQETDDVPPECEGIDEERIPDLAEIAGDEVEKASAKPAP